MSFDPLAIAVDWLDAYRAGDLDAMIDMYADDAKIGCDCGAQIIAGREAIRAYWMQRIRDYPATNLDDLNPADDGVMISYVAGDALATAILHFNDDGLIRAVDTGLRH